MRIIDTSELTPETELNPDHRSWIYNGLDCCVTLEVFEVIEPMLDEVSQKTYDFRRALQAPVLEMNMRGILVDKATRDKVVASYRKDLEAVDADLKYLLREGLGIELNWNSPTQLVKFFYETLGLPPIRKRNSKGQYTPTTDRKALEQLSAHFIARPFISRILFLKDLAKKISVLTTEIDKDGRMRTSYNIVGTTTGRFSSSMSDFGTGTNLQNVEERLRSVFTADPGMKLAYIDLEQAESRACGAIHWNLFHDGRYLDACESGDLHTTVCKMAWTELPWVGTAKGDKEVAERPFYRQHSFRHMAKVLGHGSNYRGKPYTMSKHTNLPATTIGEFQIKYFKAFPAFPKWHQWVATELYTKGFLTTMLGMRRYFFGRRDDDTTIREAIAFEPQSVIGELLNMGLLAVWRMNTCQVLLQIHDAIVVQYPEELEDEILPSVIKALQIPIQLKHDRVLIVPSEAKTGWNWGSAQTDKNGNIVGNPGGLQKYKQNDKRTYKRDAETPLLDRVVS